MQTFTDLPVGTKIRVGKLRTPFLRDIQEGLFGVIVQPEEIYEPIVSSGYMVRFHNSNYGWDLFIYPDEIASIDLPFEDKDLEEAFV